MRPHIAAIYAFARTADDFADEPGYADRRAAAAARRLARRRGSPRARRRQRDRGDRRHDARPDLSSRLAQTIRDRRLPVALFEDLLSAFRQDVTTTRYATWDDVLDYCRRSANPVGRLVLRVAGYDDARLDAQSDAVCTALQLTNFWQDLARDWASGRLYVPREDRHRAGAREEDLAAATDDAGVARASMAAMVARTRELFAAGRGRSATASAAGCARSCA